MLFFLIDLLFDIDFDDGPFFIDEIRPKGASHTMIFVDGDNDLLFICLLLLSCCCEVDDIVTKLSFYSLLCGNRLPIPRAQIEQTNYCKRKLQLTITQSIMFGTSTIIIFSYSISYCNYL